MDKVVDRLIQTENDLYSSYTEGGPESPVQTQQQCVWGQIGQIQI